MVFGVKKWYLLILNDKDSCIIHYMWNYRERYSPIWFTNVAERLVNAIKKTIRINRGQSLFRSHREVKEMWRGMPVIVHSPLEKKQCCRCVVWCVLCCGAAVKVNATWSPPLHWVQASLFSSGRRKYCGFSPTSFEVARLHCRLEAPHWKLSNV